MHVLNPWYLAGLLAVALPILIHLLLRDRIKRIIFPATRFLLGASRKITRTQALRELILLILRAAAIFILVIALARPFFMSADEEAAAMGSTGAAAVFVIDTSASMRVGARMNNAKAQAREALKKFRPQLDRVAVLTFDSEPSLLAPFSSDMQKVASAIEGLAPGFGGTNLLAAVQKANQMLTQDDYKHSARQIVLFSDLHRSGWSFHDEHLTPGIGFEAKPAAIAAADNVAITQAAIPKSTVVSARNEPISVQVVNFGKEDRKSLRVAFAIEGTKADEKFINLGPGKTEVVRFAHKFEKPGECTGVITVDAQDDFPEDNTWFFNVRVLPRVRVLLVNGTPDKAAANDDGRFVKEALSVPGSPFQVSEVTPQNLSAKDLEGVQAVVFANVGVLPGAMPGVLKEFLGRGGGIMIFPGDKCLCGEFNKSYAGLSPCKLKQITSRDEKSEGWTIGEIDFQHPIFAHFAMPQSGDFTNAKFSKFFSVSDSQSAHVLARFVEGQPALLEQAIGKGFSLLFTSTAGMKWNDFCLQGGIFVPFIHESLKYLSVHSEGLTAALVGETLALGPGGELYSPDSVKIAAGSGGNLTAKAPGIYTVKYADREERLAVNISRVESETAMMNSQELAAALESNPEGQAKKIEGQQVWVKASNSVRERIEAGQKFGWYLLFALLALLLAEHVLANNTSRH